jgi:hypothetical protein
MRHLKKFYEDFEIRGDSLMPNQVEDWEFIKEIFLYSTYSIIWGIDLFV